MANRWLELERTLASKRGVVQGMPKGKPGSFYKQVTKLHLAQSTIDGLLTRDLETAVSGLKRDFPDYDSYPMGVQEALIDMVFNLGNVSGSAAAAGNRPCERGRLSGRRAGRAA